MAARILGAQRCEIVVRLDYGLEVYDLARGQLEDERTHRVRRSIGHLRFLSRGTDRVRIAFRGTRRLISLIHMSCDFFGLH